MTRITTSALFLMAGSLLYIACADDDGANSTIGHGGECPEPTTSQGGGTTSAGGESAGGGDAGGGGQAPEGQFEAVTVLQFDALGSLFVADSATGEIHAMTPPASDNPSAGEAYNLRNIDTTIADLLGSTPSAIRVRDLAVHPTTTEAYLAVARPNGDTLSTAIVIINQTGAARLLDAPIDQTVALPFAPAQDFLFYEDFPSRDLSITDLAIHDGTLYAAGLSNADFASSLWTIPVPFSGTPTVSTVEIYHGVHAQNETRAPIRTMAITDVNGVPTMLAAYTCTPLVGIPLADIVDGASVTGKTIAELGYGNTPGDIVAFTGADAQQNPVPMLFIQNKNQGAQVIPMAAIDTAMAGPGITTPLGLSKVDLGALETPMTNILQIEDLDPGHFLSVRRDPEEGDLELMSFLKNVYFRLSDFQSEYEIPSYVYPPEQEPIKQFQNMMKIDEGHPDAVVP